MGLRLVDGSNELELPNTLGQDFHVGLKLGHHADLELSLPGDDCSNILDEPVVVVYLVLRDASVLEVQVDESPHVFLSQPCWLALFEGIRLIHF